MGIRLKPSRKEVAAVKRLVTHEQGQGLVEYAMIIILVAILVMVLLITFGGAVGNLFSNIVASI